MPQFIIEPHFPLQEWVAEEKSYLSTRILQSGIDAIVLQVVFAA